MSTNGKIDVGIYKIHWGKNSELTMLANANATKTQMTAILTPQRLRIGAWIS